MNFELTKEQVMIKKMVRDFAEEIIRPRAIEIDTKAEFPSDIFDQMGSLVYWGFHFQKNSVGLAVIQFLMRLRLKRLVVCVEVLG